MDLQLKRVLRGGGRKVVERIGASLGPFRVEDLTGRVLAGTADAGESPHDLEFEGQPLGVLWAPADASVLSELIVHLYERELAQRGLAAETLGRYKELALIYDLGETLTSAVGVEEVAQIVVDGAVTFLHATSAEIFTINSHTESLEPLASSLESAKTVAINAAAPIVRDVLDSQRSQFDVDDSRSTMCAPLRSGEDVFGVLVVSNDEATQWTAGDLKLVTSLATKAADAISRATLHRAQMKAQALRGKVDRFVSDALIEATCSEGRTVAVVYCDLAEVTQSDTAHIDAEAALARLESATAISLALLLEADATVNIGHGEMLVATFRAEEFADAAVAAVDAAQALGRALDGRNGGPSPRPLGLAVVSAECSDTAAFFAAVGGAATLQAKADGRILIDTAVAEHLTGRAVQSETIPNTYELLP